MSTASTGSACHIGPEDDESGLADRSDALGQIDPALSTPVDDERLDRRHVSRGEVRGSAARSQRGLSQYARTDRGRLFQEYTEVALHPPFGTAQRGLGNVRSELVQRIRIRTQQPRRTGQCL